MIQDPVHTTPSGERKASIWFWFAPCLYVFLIGLYFIGRYGGTWAEADSTTFTSVIRRFVEGERLVPSYGPIYPNGYAYQTISTFVLGLTGLEVATLQQLVYPMLGMLVVLPAWVLYREWTGSPSGATIATMLLFTQPEFLFVVLRSSHEKFTRTFMLLCLLFLTRSFRVRNEPRNLAIYVVLFYLSVYAFISSNNLLAHSFVFAVMVALFFGWTLSKRRSFVLQTSHALNRFIYIVVICLIFVYLLTFYIYTPAKHDLIVIKDSGKLIQALLLDVQTTGGTQAVNAYEYLQTGWINIRIYLLVSIANWIVLTLSFVIWVYQGLRWVWRGDAFKTQTTWLMWLLYAAFALQGAMSVVADASGALGSNLQHRLFPSFSILSVALLVAALTRWRFKRMARSLQLVLAGSVFCITILSVFKATNEPLLSNKWTFYRPSEVAALGWIDSHLKDSDIWTEFDERLAVAQATALGNSLNNNAYHGYFVRPTTRTFLVSTVTRLRSVRMRGVLPVLPDASRVYDNGEAQVYRLRSRTPFQK